MPGEDEFDMAGAVESIGADLFEQELPAEGGGDDAIDAGTGASADPDPAPTDTPPAPADEPPADPTEATQTSAPDTWRPEAAAEFASLSPVVQQEILKREEDIRAGMEQYKETAAFGESIKATLAPYLPILEHHGIDPNAQIGELLRAQYTLAYGAPEAKAALIGQLVQAYGIDVSQIVAGDVEVSPEVSALQNEIRDLKSKLQGIEDQGTAARKAEITNKITAFAADPKNVYFEEVAKDIVHLLRTGAETTIEAAYDAAVWRNPATRAKEQARQQAEKDAAAQKAEQEAAAAAEQAAAANVRTRAKRGSGAAPVGSMEDTLKETLAAIEARSS